jgi:hypothetical protein
MTVPCRGGGPMTGEAGLVEGSNGRIGGLTAPCLLSNLMMKPCRGGLAGKLLGGGR